MTYNQALNKLGLSEGFSDIELTRAKRNYSKRYHPDLYIGRSKEEIEEAEAIIKDLNDAYDILKNNSASTLLEQYKTTLIKKMCLYLLDKINDIVKSNLAKINLTEEDYYLDVTDINTCKVFLLENKNFDKVIGEKEIKINYTGNYNTSDEQYVRNKVNQLDFNHILDYYDMTEEYTEDTYNRKQEEFVSTIKEMINDDTIDVIAAYGSAGGGGYGDIGFYATHVNFFKNNILYHVAYSTSYMVNTVYVPESVEDTDKAYIDYALPIVTEFYKENFTVNSVEKVTDENIIEDDSIVLKNNGEFYKINFNELDYDGNKAWARIIIKKKAQKIIEGDLDGNNIVNANDAALALDLYKYGNVTPEQLKVADMDNNGIINANDAALILDIYKYGN